MIWFPFSILIHFWILIVLFGWKQKMVGGFFWFWLEIQDGCQVLWLSGPMEAVFCVCFCREVLKLSIKTWGSSTVTQTQTAEPSQRRPSSAPSFSSTEKLTFSVNAAFLCQVQPRNSLLLHEFSFRFPRLFSDFPCASGTTRTCKGVTLSSTFKPFYSFVKKKKNVGRCKKRGYKRNRGRAHKGGVGLYIVCK